MTLAAFERNLKNLKQKECQLHNNVLILYPFFEILGKEDYVNAILREIRQVARGSETYSTPLKLLHISLGKYIYKKYEVRDYSYIYHSNFKHNEIIENVHFCARKYEINIFLCKVFFSSYLFFFITIIMFSSYLFFV